MLSNKLLSSIGNTDRLYVDDVFSAYTYIGNGSTQTINNGIDLAGKGGLVWAKVRNSSGYNHLLVDSARGTANLCSNSTPAQNSAFTAISSFNSDGFTAVSPYGANVNGLLQVAWTFRRAPKFFDVVTYTGNGVAGRQIPHTLGIAPGMIIVKKISDTGDWHVYHASLGTSQYMVLNSTSQALNFSAITAVSTSNITLPADESTNGSGATYVAYLFAHDTSTDGIIQCGSYTGTNPSINLGWEPQFVITKCISFSSEYTGWGIFDSSRGLTVGRDTPLLANSSDAENGTYNYNGYDYLTPTATGFIAPSTTLAGGGGRAYIYLAIRRPNKPPTTGTQVYNAVARTGTGAAATVTGVGFAPDLVTSKSRAVTRYHSWIDRLRGATQSLSTNVADAEGSDLNSVTAFGVDGASLGTSLNSNGGGETYINHFFRRAPGFFDVVCYAGDGVNGRVVPHQLGATPGLVIVKQRSTSSNWKVTAFDGSTYSYLVLNSTTWHNQNATYTYGKVGSVSSAGFTLEADIGFGSGISEVNSSGQPYVAYLFASLPGISKVGKYIGNATSQAINCGFSAGARFVLIKKASWTGGWFVWDSTRGIVSANDPHLQLNTSASEVTDVDSIDPESTGFLVNQNGSTDINTNNEEYIYLAIA